MRSHNKFRVRVVIEHGGRELIDAAMVELAPETVEVVQKAVEIEQFAGMLISKSNVYSLLQQRTTVVLAEVGEMLAKKLGGANAAPEDRRYVPRESEGT